MTMRYFHPAAPNELQCDLDTFDAVGVFKNGVRMLKESNHVTVVKSFLRRSKNNWHGIVVLEDNMPAMERTLLQLALGDDPVRGLMNWGRVKNNDPVPILLIDDRNTFKDPYYAKKFSCDCANTDKLPRCKHLKSIQTSLAEFVAADKKGRKNNVQERQEKKQATRGRGRGTRS